jgi:hypothetical protein
MLGRLFGKSSRERKVFFHRIEEKDSVDNPITPKKKGFDEHTLDRVSAAELRNKYHRRDGNLDRIADACKRKYSIARSFERLDGAGQLAHTFVEAQAYWARSISTTDYINGHCWRSTAASIGLLVSDLLNLGLISLEIKAEFDTMGCEFYVSPGKNSDASMEVNRLTALQARALGNA